MNIKTSFIRKRGNNYNVIVEYINENGDVKQKSLGKYSNKKDAEKHLIDLKSSINNNKFVISKDITLIERCYKYIDDNSEQWSPYTIKNRKSWIKNYYTPFFRNTELAKVTPYQLQIFSNQLLEKVSLESYKVRLGFLRAVLKESYRLKEIQENPFDFVKLSSKKDNFKAQVYTKEEILTLIKNIDGDITELPILLMLLCGLRFAEACGLRWCDVDFNNNLIHINQIIVYQGKDGFLFKEPKTTGSIRSMHVVPELMEKLKKEKIRQNELKLKGVFTNEYDLVCLNSKLSPWLNSILYTNFDKFLKRNNLRKIRLHDLRHTNATIMLLSGTNMKTVSERLGHSDIKISMNKYSHVLDEMDKEASNNLSNLLFNKNVK